MQVETFSSIDHIKESEWNQLVHPDDVFNNFHFHKALELSNSIGIDKGQIPQYITVRDNLELKAACVVYIKGHSYGEYIFDWSWANFYQHHGVNYYPKLVAQNPFTPANNRTFLYKDEKYLYQIFSEINNLSKHYNCSSEHFLFLSSKEKSLLPSHYKERSSFQYHWNNNEYISFEDFLSTLKSKKAKQIRKERQTKLTIRTLKEEEIEHYAESFFNLYLSTIQKKQSYAYLNLDFFKYIFKYMKSSTRLIVATDNTNVVAASLFFIGKNKLYGRYWGTQADHNNLHFELCYYQGIEMAINEKINIFEAGAQGEHKIPRGFEPTYTYSAHSIKNAQFQEPIYNFIEEEKQQVDNIISELKSRLPFKRI